MASWVGSQIFERFIRWVPRKMRVSEDRFPKSSTDSVRRGSDPTSIFPLSRETDLDQECVSRHLPPHRHWQFHSGLDRARRGPNHAVPDPMVPAQHRLLSGGRRKRDQGQEEEAALRHSHHPSPISGQPVGTRQDLPVFDADLSQVSELSQTPQAHSSTCRFLFALGAACNVWM